MRSDEVARSWPVSILLRLQPRAPAEGVYTPAAIDATYDELVRLATGLLARGESVILDATWSASGHREAARRAANDTGSDMIELCCQALLEVAERREANRGPDASDMTVEIVRQLTGTADPWSEARIVDTTPHSGRVVASALEHLGDVSLQLG